MYLKVKTILHFCLPVMLILTFPINLFPTKLCTFPLKIYVVPVLLVILINTNDGCSEYTV